MKFHLPINLIEASHCRRLRPVLLLIPLVGIEAAFVVECCIVFYWARVLPNNG